MRKLYFIVIAIAIIIFIGYIVNSLSDFSSKLLTVTSSSLTSSSFSSSGSFAFKSSSERKDILAQMLKINLKFMSETNTNESNINLTNIKNFYKLEKFFPNFKHYYIAKQKIKKAVFTELPTFYSATSSLSDSELNLYFNNNIAYLEKNWGIKEFSDLVELVNELKPLNGKNVISCELEESYFYSPKSNILNFRIILKPENSDNIYLFLKADIYNSTDNQDAPVIKFYGITGGTSYV